MTEKAVLKTLYVCRLVANAAAIISWAKAQGFDTTLTAEDMHVTLCYSRAAVDWMKAGEAYAQDDKGQMTIKPGGPRAVEPLGDKGAVVLMFASSELVWRHMTLKEMGASWDYEGFQPHITLTYRAPEGLDVSKVEPYRGEIVLGPELFEEVDPAGFLGGLAEKAHAQVLKVDMEHGLVFGWAIICKVNGIDYYDLNVDRDTFERVPEHIPETTMLKAAVEFMHGDERPGNEMHRGPDLGKFVFAFPLTTDIAKALGIETAKTGLLVAYKPPAAVLAKFKDGTYKGFSIEGKTWGHKEQHYA